MAIVISKLAVLLTAQTAQFLSRMDKAETKTRSFGRSAKKMNLALSAAIGAGVGLAVRQLARYGASIEQAIKKSAALIDQQTKMARQLGLSQSALAGLTRQARFAGVEQRKLQLGLQRMTRRVAEAARGTGEAQEAIATLGLDAQSLARLSPDKQFMRIADAMGNVHSQGEKVRLSFKLFDSEGVELLRLMEGGSNAIAQFVEEAKALNLGLTRLETSRIERMQDAFADMQDTVQGMANTLTVKLAPIITMMTERVTRDLKDINFLIQAITERSLFTRQIPLLDFNRSLNRLFELFSGFSLGGASSPTASPIPSGIATETVDLLRKLVQQNAQLIESQNLEVGTLRTLVQDTKRLANFNMTGSLPLVVPSG